MTNRGYKRSWKNLLINKRYQLRFTLFMVGLALVLMALLGWWVVRVANDATHVAESRQRREPCAALPVIAATPVVVDSGTMTFDDAPPAPAPDAAAPSGRTIVMDEPTMRLTLPDAWVKDVQKNLTCRLERAGKIAALQQGERRIVVVLVVSGLLVVVGLVLFGIKMTHRVAGPLYKVTLYLAKLRDGRYDKVYDLRKGDQLREFYEHFREAHAGVVAIEQADRDRIAAALDAAVADGVLTRSPQARAAADELRAILDRKEKALGHQS